MRHSYTKQNFRIYIFSSYVMLQLRYFERCLSSHYCYKRSALLTFCEWNLLVTGGFHSHWASGKRSHVMTFAWDEIWDNMASAWMGYEAPWRLHGMRYEAPCRLHGMRYEAPWRLHGERYEALWRLHVVRYGPSSVVSKHDRVSTFTIAMLNSALSYIGQCYNVTQRRYTSSRQTLNVQMGCCINNDILTGPGFIS